MSGKGGSSMPWRWLGIFAAFVAWPLVYYGALFLVGALVSRGLTSFDLRQGYWTFIGIGSTGVAPVGWAVSLVIYLLWRRLWFVLAFPVFIGAVFALVPVLFRMV
jgi:hypothetical protein